jgi:hypothetical protein
MLTLTGYIVAPDLYSGFVALSGKNESAKFLSRVTNVAPGVIASKSPEVFDESNSLILFEGLP